MSTGNYGPLRLAVPRGALFGDTLDLLDRIGVDTEPLRSDSRSLLFPGKEMTLVTRTPAGVVEKRTIPVRFVPMTGKPRP